MWFTLISDGVTNFYSHHSIVDFKQSGADAIALIEDGKNVIEVFLTQAKLDELYMELDIRAQARLLRTGYVPFEQRRRNMDKLMRRKPSSKRPN